MLEFAPKLTLAYLLDLILGDPQGFPHPVRLIGYLIRKGEAIFRSCVRSELVGGALLTISLTAAAYASAHALLKSVAFYSATLSSAVEVLILYWCLSTKDLAVESRWVRDALDAKDVGLARKKLSWIVGRDTERLDEEGIARAAVETVAENTVDGIVAPLFYAALGGAPLAIAYKTVNTLDSMIGHRDDRYVLFGRIAAKVDTWANWLPARLTGLLFPLAAGMLGFSFSDSCRSAWREGSRAPVPNAGIPEGAMAGALQVQVGGVSHYKGSEIHSPPLGAPIRPMTPDRIEESIRLMYAASFLFFAVCLASRFALRRFSR